MSVEFPLAARMAALWMVLASSLLAPPAGAAAANGLQLPSIKSFFRNPDVADIRMSPSGQWLAMIVRGQATRNALAVVDIDNKTPPAIVANFSDADIRSVRWVGDDRLVFNLLDGERGGGDQAFGPGLYSIHRDGSDLRQLIKSKREFVRQAGTIRRETLEWNHELLAVPRDDSPEVIIGEYDLNYAYEVQAVKALRLDIDTGRTHSLAVGSPAYSREWLFDPKGEPRVVVAEHEGVARTYWRAPGQDAWALIATDPAQQRSFSPYFVDGAGNLFVSAGHGKDRSGALKRFNFATGKPDGDPLVVTPGFDVSGPMILDASGTNVVGLRIVTDSVTSVWFDPAMSAIQKAVDARLPGHANVIATCSRCAQVRSVLVFSSSDQDPGSYWIYRPASDDWRLIGKKRADIDATRMATLDFYRIKARDAMDLPVWVTTPPKSAPGGASGPRAAVVLVHGGPWMRGTYWRWDPEAQFLASRGYVVIEPEFRGSRGFGFVHFRAGWKQWEGAMQDDVADAVRWAAGKGLIDGKRVCIAGGSYGGYATLMGLARYADLYRCGVAWVAVTDPRLLFQDSWQSDFDAENRNFAIPTLVGDPVKDAELLRAAAPVEHAAQIRAPLLLAFGTQDRRVPLEHGTLMRDALHAAGRDPEWVVYVDEGHGWLKVENRLDFWGRVERFLDQNLNGVAPAH
ncbi:alpha/beta hydrolase family protein [Caenimonas terrae]|uniref:Alpha/beta hydrolase family protein n=1 Tax=Caenimonas terrae TaxID=696074 RepID=A0ABW0NBI6_9BURK